MTPRDDLLMLVILHLLKKRQKRKKPWLERQRIRHAITMNLLESEEISSLINTNIFDQLLKLVRPYITNNETIVSRTISEEECLIATLLYLITGKGYQELKNSTLICTQFLEKIIPETCKAIFKGLRRFIQLPKNPEEWKKTAELFEQHWQFNNCVGCIDAKHIPIQKPTDKLSTKNLNHAGTYSTICVALVNANYEFIYVDVGYHGNIIGGQLYQYTKLFDELIFDTAGLPELYPLPGTEKSVPYVFLGDGFWPLDNQCMTPYLGENISTPEQVYNYRLCRAKGVVHNAFGVLTSRFGVLSRGNLCVDTANHAVMACCALHNFLINKSQSYLTPDDVDFEDIVNGKFTPGKWRENTNQLMAVKRKALEPWNDGEKVRNDITEFLNNAGQVPFQKKMMHILPYIETVTMTESSIE